MHDDLQHQIDELTKSFQNQILMLTYKIDEKNLEVNNRIDCIENTRAQDDFELLKSYVKYIDWYFSKYKLSNKRLNFDEFQNHYYSGMYWSNQHPIKYDEYSCNYNNGDLEPENILGDELTMFKLRIDEALKQVKRYSNMISEEQISSIQDEISNFKTRMEASLREVETRAKFIRENEITSISIDTKGNLYVGDEKFENKEIIAEILRMVSKQIKNKFDLEYIDSKFENELIE